MLWDHEPQTSNPKGIPPQSPGLPSLRGYPGFEVSVIYNPNGVAPIARRSFTDSLHLCFIL
jgi:hypothetical protein